MFDVLQVKVEMSDNTAKAATVRGLAAWKTTASAMRYLCLLLCYIVFLCNKTLMLFPDTPSDVYQWCWQVWPVHSQWISSYNLYMACSASATDKSKCISSQSACVSRLPRCGMEGRRRREHSPGLAAAARRRSCVGGGNITIGGGGVYRPKSHLRTGIA